MGCHAERSEASAFVLLKTNNSRFFAALRMTGVVDSFTRSPAWVTEIRDQCLDARVPFFFKQWGGTRKKKAGRELEGRTWDEMPGVSAIAWV
jgi:hypothetical protein